MGAGPTDASERHVKEIIAELGLSQSGKMESHPCPDLAGCLNVPEARGQVELLRNGSPRHPQRCINHGESHIKPERCGCGQTQVSGVISGRAGHLDAQQMRSAIRPHHVIH